MVEYVLGDEVMVLKARDKDGEAVVSSSWKAVLGYAHEIRKCAMDRVNYLGEILVGALRFCMDDEKTLSLQMVSSLTTDRNVRTGASQPSQLNDLHNKI